MRASTTLCWPGELLPAAYRRTGKLRSTAAHVEAAFVGDLESHADGGESRPPGLPGWRDAGQVDWAGGLGWSADSRRVSQDPISRRMVVLMDDALLLIAAAACPFSCVTFAAVRAPVELDLASSPAHRPANSQQQPCADFAIPSHSLPAAPFLLHALRLVNRNLGLGRARPDCSRGPCLLSQCLRAYSRRAGGVPG